MSILARSYLSVALVSLLFLTACGGGSSGTDDSASEVSGDTDAAGEETDAALQSGRFVDSAVIGLSYETETQSGRTDDDGTFQYASGETVVFSIGDVELPAVPGGALITPLTVFNTDNIADIRVINLARLLQSLDVDGDADNGITISDQAIASATGLTLDFASPDFDTSAINLVANGGSFFTTLIDGETALDHFQETLFDEGIMERPEAPVDVVAPEPGENPATHPLVGTVAEFTTRSHDVTGTVTILDDRTIQITDFFYDGGGPSVFFYTGNDGDYSSSGGGRIIGTQLNGRLWTGETVMLTLPDVLTLDDFDGLSVWCDIFNVSFGDVDF